MVSLIDLSGPTLFDAVGVAGFGLYVLNYSMLTLQRVKSESIGYFAVNLAAASMVLVGLMLFLLLLLFLWFVVVLLLIFL